MATKMTTVIQRKKKSKFRRRRRKESETSVKRRPKTIKKRAKLRNLMMKMLYWTRRSLRTKKLLRRR